MNEPSKNAEDDLLVNNLSVGDAQSLMRVEGGELTQADVLFQLGSILLVSGSFAWAIASGRVTVWHMVMPIVGEYFGYIISVPVIQAFIRHDELKKIARNCERNLIVLAIAVVAGWLIWAWMSERDVLELGNVALRYAWNWMVGSGVIWPFLLAAALSAVSVKRYVDRLIESGPPFGAMGWGCAVRIIVYFIAGLIALFFSPLFLSGSGDIWTRVKAVSDSVGLVWAIWALMLIAQVLAIWIHWDVQRRLKNAGQFPKPVENGE